MANTTFTDNSTPIVASWLNPVNTSVYSAIGNGTTAPSTPAEVVANLGVLTIAVAAATYVPLTTLANYSTTAIIAATYAPLTSASLVTPNLGTPSAGVLTNCTGTAAGLSIGGSAGSLSSYTGTDARYAPLVAGHIIDFAGTTAPAGYLVCPIAATDISRTTYAALFAAIGTTWGAGDGSTTFGMPWFPANYSAVQANANVGTSSVGEVIAHTHTLNAYGTYGSGAAAVSLNQFAPNTTYASNSTGGTANLAAGVRVLKCVKY